MRIDWNLYTMFVKAVLLFAFMHPSRYTVHGGCTYTEINTSLNTCVRAATTSSTVRWFFPHGSIAEQAEFCQSSAQSTLETCINTIFYACRLDAKSIKMFGTQGYNLLSAYSNLCTSSYINEAQACMSVVSDTASFVTAETAFKSASTALSDSATTVELCGLATTMKYTAYTSLLSQTCTDADHRAVWSSFYTTILNTYVCTCGSSAVYSSHMMVFISSAIVLASRIMFLQ